MLHVQSTYCDNIRQHCETIGRTVHVVNLGVLKTTTRSGRPPQLLAPRKFSVDLQSSVRHASRSGCWACTHKALQKGSASLNGQRDFAACHADPAADAFSYPVAFDVRDLVTLEDVMEEMELGPNG